MSHPINKNFVNEIYKLKLSFQIIFGPSHRLVATGRSKRNISMKEKEDDLAWRELTELKLVFGIHMTSFFFQEGLKSCFLAQIKLQVSQMIKISILSLSLSLSFQSQWTFSIWCHFQWTQFLRPSFHLQWCLAYNIFHME